jgi:hypothetical protein
MLMDAVQHSLEDVEDWKLEAFGRVCIPPVLRINADPVSYFRV